VPAMSFDDLDPHSQRILQANDALGNSICEQEIKNARRAYFANISYLDHQIGKLRDVLAATKMDENTIIIFTADHGDMLGEKGLWYKMSFFEGSARIPLMIRHPDLRPRTCTDPVSLMDIMPTLCDMVRTEIARDIDGQSLLPQCHGERRETPVFMEYCAEASHAPMVCMRTRDRKFIHTVSDPDLCFHLPSDPHEMDNLASSKEAQSMRTHITSQWDMAQFDDQVRQSQRHRHSIYQALRKGRFTPWDFQPQNPAHSRFMRNHMDLNEVEANARFPK
ncbi:MAG: sulfatase-like hydrolase/transferase, partial [Pseudomonadota bacterium]